jgi:hypothetical protein
MADGARFTIIQTGDGNSAYQVNGPVGSAGDLEAMGKFIDAATGSLGALALSPARREEAARAVEALNAEPAPDRRRALAASLWRIVEGAAGSALGGALIGLWHP